MITQLTGLTAFLLLSFGFFKQVEALKCYQCFNGVDCAKSNVPIVECDKNSVMETAAHYQFLPNVLNQVPTMDFTCNLLNGAINNSTVVSIRGCFYSSYNPCAFVVKADKTTVEYKCKYCNSDKCNSSVRLTATAANLLPITALLLFKLIYLF